MMENMADMLYSSYIRYDRMYEMTRFAFHGYDSDHVNVYVDVYSMLKILYSRYQNMEIRDSYAIASCMINLAIHIRGYFESRHRTTSTIYLIYGGARLVPQLLNNLPEYNSKNILMEDSDSRIKDLIKDNLEVMRILCPYLNDIFCVVDDNNEFSAISAYLIQKQNPNIPNVIYSKSQLAYQLVAYFPKTFLYRPKKSRGEDVSWVVTKSTLIDAYRFGELKLKKETVPINYKLLNIYQTISGLKDRSITGLINATNSVAKIKFLVDSRLLLDGYNSPAVIRENSNNNICKVFETIGLQEDECLRRLSVIDLQSQTVVYSLGPSVMELSRAIVNLYDPDTVKAINNKYFDKYPLDLNRV